MTKTDFCRYAESVIRDLCAMAKEIAPETCGIWVRYNEGDGYEATTVNAYSYDGEATHDTIYGDHHITIMDNGGRINKEDVA